MNIQDGTERNVIASLLTSGTSATSLNNVCAFKPSYDYCTPQLC